MADFLLLMHGDARRDVAFWGPYLAWLRESGRFQGGSAIGAGHCVRRDADAAAMSTHLTGFIRVSAESLAAVTDLLVGNPVYEAGGTIEIRALPAD